MNELYSLNKYNYDGWGFRSYFLILLYFIFCLLTKVDDWVGFSSQPWSGQLLLVRVE